MERRLVARGVIAGTLAGLVAFVFGRIFAEPQIQKAIDYETARDALAAAAPHDELFTRAVQADVGLGVGLVLFGAAVGALFAVAYAICLGRTGRLRPRSLALLVAASGFVGCYLVPFVKYPANPPGIGYPETIKARSGDYLLMVFCGLVVLLLAVWLGQQLRRRLGNWNASLVAGTAYVAAMGIVMAVLPSFHETPGPLRDAHGTILLSGFPADVLFHFRLAALGVQATLWSVLGLVYAPLAERLLGSSVTTGEQPALV